MLSKIQHYLELFMCYIYIERERENILIFGIAFHLPEIILLTPF